jgi:signal peptidase I
MKKVVTAILTLAVLINLAARLYWFSVLLLITLAIILLLSLRWGDYPVLKRTGFLKTPLLFLSAVVLAIVVRLFIFGIYNIDSSSMKDTLIPGDYIWVNKTCYGPVMPSSVYEIPWIGVGYWLIKGRPSDISSKVWKHRRLNGYSGPAVNDVIVFYKPGTPEEFVKRCIATPGDTLEIIQGEVIVNGTVIDPDGKIRRGSNIAPDWKVYPGIDTLGWDIDNWGPYIVPYRGMVVSRDDQTSQVYNKMIINNEGIGSDSISVESNAHSGFYTFRNDYYFMVGDNRHASHDSRFFGPVPETDIIGRATFILFSKGGTKDIERRSLRSLR